MRLSMLAAVASIFRGAIADPKTIRRQFPLPETADELCLVAGKFGATDADVFLGQRANENNIKALSESGELQQRRILHFATHGFLAGELAESSEPGLILTPPNAATRRDDGFLSASEVAGLKLDANLVVLSACNTASGDVHSGQALSGLAKAFFFAGARSLLVSHWYVESRATVALITKMFDTLQREPTMGRSRALRLAMQSLIQSKRDWHPARWAPFVVVGEGAN